MYEVLTAYRAIEKSDDKILKNQLHTLENSKLKHKIQEGGVGDNVVTTDGEMPISSEKNAASGDTTFYNFSNESKKQFQDNEGVVDSNFSTVVHEMRHQYDNEIGNMGDDTGFHNAENPVEIRAVYNENRARKIEGIPERKNYGTPIAPKKLSNPPNNKNIIKNSYPQLYKM